MTNNQNFKQWFFISISLLIICIIFNVISCQQSNKKVNALEIDISDKIKANNVLSERIDSLFSVESELKVQLFNCQTDKFLESSKKRQYENRLQNIEEDCEHEKDALLLNSRINNSTDNELGILLSRLGQHESLTDAERFLLSEQGNKGIFKSYSGGDRIEKQVKDTREKNKSP
jgi:nitrogen-specific signal transduction histidine kinase